MSTNLSPDVELYRQQLEARARIYYASSGVIVCVSQAESGEHWIADLHPREGEHEGPPLPPYLERPAGVGVSPERALEELADDLDARERSTL